MALELEYTVKKTGVVGNYWRIVGYDAQKNNIHKITFALYPSSSQRENEFDPITYAYVYVTEPTDESHFQRDYIYQAVKDMNVNIEGINIHGFFKDAQDV